MVPGLRVVDGVVWCQVSGWCCMVPGLRVVDGVIWCQVSGWLMVL